jgi:hypothetical protein
MARGVETEFLHPNRGVKSLTFVYQESTGRANSHEELLEPLLAQEVASGKKFKDTGCSSDVGNSYDLKLQLEFNRYVQPELAEQFLRGRRRLLQRQAANEAQLPNRLRHDWKQPLCLRENVPRAR